MGLGCSKGRSFLLDGEIEPNVPVCEVTKRGVEEEYVAVDKVEVIAVVEVVGGSCSEDVPVEVPMSTVEVDVGVDVVVVGGGFVLVVVTVVVGGDDVVLVVVGDGDDVAVVVVVVVVVFVSCRLACRTRFAARATSFPRAASSASSSVG